MNPLPGLTYRTIGGILDIYIVFGDNPEAVTQRYTQVTFGDICARCAEYCIPECLKGLVILIPMLIWHLYIYKHLILIGRLSEIR